MSSTTKFLEGNYLQKILTTPHKNVGRFADNSSAIETTSVEMKLLILLLSFRYLLVSSAINYYDDEVSYEEISGDYTGYESCGYNGWSCLPNNEIAFECYALKPVIICIIFLF